MTNLEQKIDLLLMDYDYLLKINAVELASTVADEIERVLTQLPANEIVVKTETLQ